MENWTKESVTEAISAAVIQVLNEGMTISPEFEEENIHQFRVATKKLRALLRLVEDSQEQVSSKMPKKFKKLYSLSGFVRDGQLMIHRVKETQPEIPEYLVFLKDKLVTDKLNYTDYYDSDILNKLSKRLKKQEPDTLTQEAVENFFRKRFQEIEEILSLDDLEEDHLHEIRKKVKDLQHIAKTLTKYWPDALEGSPISTALKQMEKLAQQAGDFNDQHNALVSLETYLEKYPSTANLEKVRTDWAADREKEKQKLVKEITKFKNSGKKALSQA